MVSTVDIPPACAPVHNTDQVAAPRLDNSRQKIIWSEDGIKLYREVVSKSLEHIQNLWLLSPSPASLQVALQSTNSIMSLAASMTNKSISLGVTYSPRSAPVPREIKRSQKALLRKHRLLSRFTGRVQTCKV